MATACPRAARQVETEIKYAGYIERQQQQVERMARLEHYALPADLEYSAVAGLRREAREQLQRLQPHSLGQASRLSGVNPADISILWVYLRAREPRSAPQSSTNNRRTQHTD
jgi:tRNA uridine 5-carboxymethylaminomethyl modification enzyme